MMLVYDGGVLTEPSSIRLPAEELASFAFVEPRELDSLMVPRLARRVRESLRALREGVLVELEHGAGVER